MVSFYARFSVHLLIIVCVNFSACKRKSYEFQAIGTVYNKNTGEPIEGAKVILRDGLATNDPVLPSEGPNSESIVLTNEKGGYAVKLESSTSWHAVLSVQKESFTYEKKIAGTVQNYEMIGEGVHAVSLPLVGFAHFDSPFSKSSYTTNTNDSIRIMLLSYDDISDDLRSLGWSAYDGEGPFHFFVFGGAVLALGDRYLRYKLEWTNDGVWQSKIDSVYLPTSTEVYRDTIYY